MGHPAPSPVSSYHHHSWCGGLRDADPWPRGSSAAKKLRTIIPDPDRKRGGDLLNRDFTAASPSLVWVTDLTNVHTWAGFVYVAFILDVFAQRVVGWHASSSENVDLVMTPQRIALW